MSGLEEKLNAILGNREAMGQIMAIAQSLGNGEEPAAREDETEGGFVPVEPAQDGGGVDLGSILGGVDPNMVEMGMRLLGEYNRTDDRKAALLSALRPFVKESRFANLDRAVRIARLSRVVRVLFDVMKEKGGDGLV